MACEFSNNNSQVVNPGESVVFTASPVPCNRGLVRHRNDTGNFLLKGNVRRSPCGCCPSTAKYLVDFGANIAIPTTPAAVEEFFNVSDATIIPIWSGCCQTLTVRNISDQPILVSSANIIFSRPDLNVTY